MMNNNEDRDHVDARHPEKMKMAESRIHRSTLAEFSREYLLVDRLWSGFFFSKTNEWQVPEECSAHIQSPGAA